MKNQTVTVQKQGVSMPSVSLREALILWLSSRNPDVAVHQLPVGLLCRYWRIVHFLLGGRCAGIVVCRCVP